MIQSLNARCESHEFMLTQSIFLLPLFSRKSTSKSGFNGTFFYTAPPPPLSFCLSCYCWSSHCCSSYRRCLFWCCCSLCVRATNKYLSRALRFISRIVSQVNWTMEYGTHMKSSWKDKSFMRIAIACHFCGWLTSLPPSLVLLLLLMCAQFSMDATKDWMKKRAITRREKKEPNSSVSRQSMNGEPSETDNGRSHRHILVFFSLCVCVCVYSCFNAQVHFKWARCAFARTKDRMINSRTRSEKSKNLMKIAVRSHSELERTEKSFNANSTLLHRLRLKFYTKSLVPHVPVCGWLFFHLLCRYIDKLC